MQTIPFIFQCSYYSQLSIYCYNTFWLHPSKRKQTFLFNEWNQNESFTFFWWNEWEEELFSAASSIKDFQSFNCGMNSYRFWLQQPSLLPPSFHLYSNLFKRQLSWTTLSLCLVGFVSFFAEHWAVASPIIHTKEPTQRERCNQPTAAVAAIIHSSQKKFFCLSFLIRLQPKREKQEY